VPRQPGFRPWKASPALRGADAGLAARAAKTYTTGFGALPAVIRAGFDQVPLKGGEASQDSHKQFTLRRRRIAPRIMQRLELRTLLGKRVQDIEQVARAAGEPCSKLSSWKPSTC
jgi:hypothetical protein